MTRERIRRMGLWLMPVLVAVVAVLVAAHDRYRLRLALSPLWVRTVHDISYGPWPENRLDILTRRWSAGQADHPAVIVFHGGGWRDGRREDMLVGVCHRYLERGFVVANVEYRQGAIPAASEDAALALKWFFRHAPEYGGNRARMVVTGESAGAHLALLAAFRSEERMAAIVNFYGVSDLVAMLDRPAIRAVLPGDHPELVARELSPLTYVRPGLPPLISIHGTADELVPVSQTAILTRAVREAGGEARVFYVEGGKHGFGPNQQESAYAAVFDFLKHCDILDH